MQDAHRVLVTRSRYVHPAHDQLSGFPIHQEMGRSVSCFLCWNTGRITKGKDSPVSSAGNLAGGVATFIRDGVCEAAERP